MLGGRTTSAGLEEAPPAMSGTMESIFALVPSSRIGNRSVLKSRRTLPVTEIVSLPALSLSSEKRAASGTDMIRISSPLVSWS